tara:strand:- start:180 stop:455 length:276 start_codon:yes stop_codon:yes gene_type:complete
MSFWLYDPRSFKNAALFPTGGMSNFLNTLTLVVVAVVAFMKTKFKDFVDDKQLFMYSGISLAIITAVGLLFGKEEESSEDTTQYNFDLTYE